MLYAIILLSAYLLGAIPFGFLIGLSRGIDVRTVGSKNIGATNVLRTVGKPWGILAFLLDFAKGFAGAALMPLLARLILGDDPSIPIPALERLAGGLAAVAGHNWPIYLKFRGGKGVATSAGMLVAVAPAAVGLAAALWLVTFLSSRYVSLASIFAAITLAISVWFSPFAPNGAGNSPIVPILLSLLGFIIVARHHANVKRLLNGNENRFSFGKRE